MTETDLSKLPQWKGRPVPWVTRWTGQIYDTNDPKYKAVVVRDQHTGRPKFTYRDPLEYRDKYGALWLKEGIDRTGEPQWKMVSTNRQRACMTRAICQVCGDKIHEKVEGDSIPWLIDALEWESFQEAREKDSPVLTVTAPVCPDCIDLALRLCPQLVKGYHLARVDSYSLWGVHGETILNQRKVLGAVGYDEPARLPIVVARQQLVELTAYDEIGDWA